MRPRRLGDQSRDDQPRAKGSWATTRVSLSRDSLCERLLQGESQATPLWWWKQTDRLPPHLCQQPAFLECRFQRRSPTLLNDWGAQSGPEYDEPSLLSALQQTLSTLIKRACLPPVVGGLTG